ncbi:hypothetical protein [Allocoleopsis franciscana]|uniref:Uncharacterized protein n=1 Tax=Allocoleopsis franciscana PCC 7113 TaxID=1173027 RepID=K9WQ72_9CYAN|nr:hypothetical protein [Allocoleopsis franciscana]AFZ21692.1 hypothetical protein Mic7113_6096 [Allocoleopsis franciscana PCC 7113]
MSRLLDQTKDLRQDRDLNISTRDVVSPWSNPIPFGEYERTPVVVFFYSNRWIPMKCFSLAEAIALYHKALDLGKEIIVYPPHFDPYTQRGTAPPCEGEVEVEARTFASFVTPHNGFGAMSFQ